MDGELIDRETLAELLDGDSEWSIEWCSGRIEHGSGRRLPDHVLQHVPTRAKLSKLKRQGAAVPSRTFFVATVDRVQFGQTRVHLTEGPLSL